MAAAKEDVQALCAKLLGDIRNGVFAPVYLLMGDEPYYPELVCQAIIDNCVDEFAKDFNETVCFGSDVNPDQIITAARRYPMMTDRQLVVVKEAQMIKDLESLSVYCAEPLDSTVLVILMHKASADKRKSLYKTVQKQGIILDSPSLRDYEMPGWIEKYYASRGLSIDPQAAILMAESVGTDLSTIIVETDKLLKNLPDGIRSVTVSDVEKNVGVSRQFTIFELSKALSYKKSAEALRIAAHVGSSAKFAMPMAVSALFVQFNRVLRYAAMLQSGMSSAEAKAKALAGVNPYFYRDYETAVRFYPLKKSMAVVSLLCEYDYLGKGGDGGSADNKDLLVELTAKILNI